MLTVCVKRRPRESATGRRWQEEIVMSSTLFSSISLRDLQLRNRIVVSPMGMGLAEQGRATDWYLMHFGNLALSGAGLVIVGATGISPQGRSSPHCLGLWNAEQIASFQPMLSFCRRHGDAKVGIQLQHSGRKGSVAPPYENLRFLGEAEGGWTIVGPSPLAYPNRPVPKALETTEISGIVADFRNAAANADDAGFDLLELHSAHGYLLHQFLSPLTNRRADAYGGSLQNRMRFPLEAFAAVRDAWPERKPLGVRVSATDWIEGGWNLEETIVFAKALAELGCDYITASSGGISPDQKIAVGPGYQADFAAAIRREARIKTIAVGQITEARQAEAILDEGKSDLVAIGRGMIFNPRWAWHAAVELGEEYFYPPQYERSHPRMRSGDFLKPSMRA
jgi:2,4-dienoyl-CoA reductase-like NADH-dependent reductase (Old Yellow Enzyme family)